MIQIVMLLLVEAVLTSTENYRLTAEVTHDASTDGIFATAEGEQPTTSELVFFASDINRYLMAYRFQNLLTQIAFKDRFNQQICTETTSNTF